ncbi:MAG: Gfo/Idh/MocA family oxidoreductase [Pirellulales bacterium]|nr:Gfo/Idh/MocA family oxidoreductase [Pirellulales bacterium]
MPGTAKLSRRQLLRQATAASAGALGFPYLVPGSALGLADRAAPSNRITVGMIGVGRQVLAYNLPFFAGQPDCEVVALCDVDRWRLEVTEERTASYYGEKKNGEKKNRCPKVPKCPRHVDFREVLDRKDVDTVMISTPDHWHVPMSVMAVKAGKDVCCEKPLTRSIAEGRLLSDLVARHKRVFRTDSEFRSLPQFHRAVELVRNGRIGKLHTIRTGVPYGIGRSQPSPPHVDMPVPEELNYELWQGPAPLRPYTEERVHRIKDYERPGWMNIRDYCDGMILNWTTHLNDIAQWGNNTDRTGPVEVEGRGKFPPPGSLWDVCYEFEFACTYANGVRLVCKTEAPYTRFEGEEGWIQANFSSQDRLQAEPKSVLDCKIGPNEIHFLLMPEKRDFLDAVKTRGQTLADAEVGHRTSSLGHLGHIAIQLGRKLKFDPDKERFLGDDEANQMLALPPGRSPWTI